MVLKFFKFHSKTVVAFNIKIFVGPSNIDYVSNICIYVTEMLLWFCLVIKAHLLQTVAFRQIEN